MNFVLFIRYATNHHQLIKSVVQHIVETAPETGGILIFLPGVQDIRSCLEALRTIKNTTTLPLHANLSSDEQRAVFQPVSGWKIVASTNVAEVCPLQSAFAVSLSDWIFCAQTSMLGVVETAERPPLR